MKIIAFFLFPIWGILLLASLFFGFYYYGFVKGISFFLYYAYSPMIILFASGIIFSIIKIPGEVVSIFFELQIKKQISRISRMIEFSILLFWSYLIIFYFVKYYSDIMANKIENLADGFFGINLYFFKILNWSYVKLGFSTNWLVNFLKIFQVSLITSGTFLWDVYFNDKERTS